MTGAGFVSRRDEVPAGLLSSRTRVRITADGVAPQVLHELVEWADRYSLISDAIRRAAAIDKDLFDLVQRHDHGTGTKVIDWEYLLQRARRAVAP
ncbi:MAG: hypothetical protein ACRDQ7_22015 [Haloechinothrix sp.]